MKLSQDKGFLSRYGFSMFQHYKAALEQGLFVGLSSIKNIKQ